MSMGLLFWAIMILSLIFGAWNWHSGGGPYGPLGSNLLLWILLGLLGWAVFGAPIK